MSLESDESRRIRWAPAKAGVYSPPMFWRLIALVLVLTAVGMYTGYTLGGFLYVLPAAAVIAMIMRRMAKAPNTEFGRWRSYEEKSHRR